MNRRQLLGLSTSLDGSRLPISLLAFFLLIQNAERAARGTLKEATP